ncbi:MAG: triose-phosphate isomerase [Erysipelotrichaceae bacterium]|nr:triose-phosphate isomerase [Erysipelotrichaceae bacterium]MDP3306466.1 triose-phosphate isomerase [Erysipelotrichaceae bacterium]
MRKKIVGSSWKMHVNTKAQVDALALEIVEGVKNIENVDMFLIPTFPLIDHLANILRNSNVAWGAQNMAFVDYGAYTGEVPASTLADLQCTYIELGHAERRAHFNETDYAVNKKVNLCMDAGLTPLVCIGETKAEKEDGVGRIRIKTQIIWTLEGIEIEEVPKVIFAYEPVWAIGQPEGANPEYVNDMHRYIRDVIASEYGNDIAQKTRIIYGGSVKLESAHEYIRQENIDGLFTGRFALEAKNYIAIVDLVEKYVNEKEGL